MRRCLYILIFAFHPQVFAQIPQACQAIFPTESSADVIPLIHQATPTSALQESLNAAKQLLQTLLDKKEISARKFRQYIAQFEQIQASPNPKLAGTTSIAYLESWSRYHNQLVVQINTVHAMSAAKEKKAWLKKLEAPIHFALNHYVVFLTSKKREFKYERVIDILDTTDSSITHNDLPYFIYAFEKSIRVFSSEREFILCR